MLFNYLPFFLFKNLISLSHFLIIGVSLAMTTNIINGKKM